MKTVLMLTGLTFVVGTLFTFAGCSRHKSPEAKAEWVADKIESKLDLDEAQRGKLDELKVAVLEAHKRNHSQETRQARRDEIKKMVLSSNLDEQRIKSMIDNKVSVVDKEFPNIYPKLAAFHASLNDEQKADVVKFMDKMHKKKCKWR